MSVIIITGGGGKSAIDDAVAASARMDADQVDLCQCAIDDMERMLRGVIAALPV